MKISKSGRMVNCMGCDNKWLKRNATKTHTLNEIKNIKETGYCIKCYKVLDN